MRRWIWLMLAALILVTAAGAGPLPAPKIVPGRYVYTIPEGFDPPMIGRRGLEEIQQSAEKLHYPYYVVIVESFPRGLMDSASSEEDAAAQAVDGLAEDWQTKYAAFEVGKSSIFLLSYDPRQFRFLAGATWKTKLGFEKAAHDPYTAIFRRAVQGTPRDPKTGIIEMMQAVDEYLFDQTDPVRIRARKEAAERAARLQRLQAAQDRLDRQIERGEYLLRSPREFLPPGIRSYAVALDRARKVRLANEPEAMEEEAASLEKSNYRLEVHVQERRSEAAWDRFSRWLRIVAAASTAGVVLLLMLIRGLGLRRLRKKFAASLEEWNARLLNAKGRYADFYGSERGSIVGLSEMTGETKRLYDKVTSEVDAIYLGVESMEAHLNACRATAEKASLLRISPLRKAMRDLNAEFEFDTGQLSPGNLFGPPTKILEVKPEEFSKELESRYASTVEQWAELKEAAQIRLKPAEELFPESRLDEMEKVANEYGIRHTWISDHPLFGGEDEDQEIYDGANASRKSDPVAFLRQMDELADKERRISERLNRLVEAIRLARSARLEMPPPFPDTVLSPDDDPRLIFEAARREEEKLAGALASRKGDAGAAEVEAVAESVDKLYRACAEQAAAVRSAIEDAGSTIERSAAEVQSVVDLAAKAESRISEAAKVHANVGAVTALLESGRRYLEGGKQFLEDARRKLGESRHVQARREAWRASEQFSQALKDLNECIGKCDEFDKQKALYESRLAEMDHARKRAMRRIRGFGGSTDRLGDIPRPDTAGPADYLIYLAVLDRLEQDWNTQVRAAQRAHEREQERHRIEHQSRSDNDDSSSGSGWGGFSSSGGGWGGGGSSSSGGSWGGGGSSSSGGSW